MACRVPLGELSARLVRGRAAGACGARHSNPSQRHITTPRQYNALGGGIFPSGNSARNAISEELARSVMLPGESWPEKPVAEFRDWASCNRKPVEILGKNKNSNAIRGVACARSL